MWIPATRTVGCCFTCSHLAEPRALSRPFQLKRAAARSSARRSLFRSPSIRHPTSSPPSSYQYVAPPGDALPPAPANPRPSVTYSQALPIRLHEPNRAIIQFKDVLLAAGSETLKVSGIQMSAAGRHRYITTDQFINGIPVLHGSVSLRVEDATGLVDSLGANFLPDRGLPRQPKISAADAAKRVQQLLVERGMAKPGSVNTSTPTLAYTGTHPTRHAVIWCGRSQPATRRQMSAARTVSSGSMRSMATM